MNYFRGTLIKAGVIALLMLAFALIMTFLCWDAERHFKGINKEDDRSLWQKLWNRLYFSAVTISSTGYGDIVPASYRARAATIIAIFLFMLNVVGIIEPLILLRMFTRRHMV